MKSLKTHTNVSVSQDMKERIVKLTSTNAKKIHVLMAQLALTWKMLLSVNVYQVLQHYFITKYFTDKFYKDLLDCFVMSKLMNVH